MAKNILIFSDGTGQAGGLRPDQRLSNIYKLYRAMRSGPDSPIAPNEQIAFYDAGLGSETENAHHKSRLARFISNSFDLAFGLRLTDNIIDCYAFIIKHYEPGDHIYLFGFSRGAYTVRCVASVMHLCGVPEQLEGGHPLPKFGKKLRLIATEAVNKVYKHGSGQARDDYRPERHELARRFRTKYGANNEHGAPNAAPYFIGTFDTVAALGSQTLVLFLSIIPIIVIVGLVYVASLILPFEFPLKSLITVMAAIAIGFIVYISRLLFLRFKWIKDFPNKGDFKFHFTKPSKQYYRQVLDPRVMYARQANAIDETRLSFTRVKWQIYPDNVPPKRKKDEAEWFQQVWFAGNHSDIGGSYPEDESRLSDVSLNWMVEQLGSIEPPPLFNMERLKLYPDAKGMQHDEVKAQADRKPKWLPNFLWMKWKSAPRKEARGAPMHPSVSERFEADCILQYDCVLPYRPENLTEDDSFKLFYETE